MKVLILNGHGEVAKRTEVLRIKKQYSQDSTIHLDLKQNNLADLENAIFSVPLFSSGPRLIIAENLPATFSLEKFNQVGDEITLLITAADLKADSVVLKSGKNINIKMINFEGEKELSAFPFVDNLLERKSAALAELSKLLPEYGGMYILSMIYYGLRRNILPLPASSFAQKKIKEQKQKYPIQDWEKLYALTLKTEANIKSGKASEGIALVSLTQTFIAGKY